MKLKVKSAAVRRLPKALGIAFVAVCAFGTVAAASASASYNIASATGGIISGNQVTTGEWFLDVASIKCTGASLDGSQETETAEEFTLRPIYSGCTLGGLKMQFSTGTCNYRFSKTFLAGSHAAASMSIKCKSGPMIYKDYAGLGCEVKFPEQSPGGQVTFFNETGGTVLIEFKVENIRYSWTAGCPNAGGKAGENSNGRYTVTARVAGQRSGGAFAAFTVL